MKIFSKLKMATVVLSLTIGSSLALGENGADNTKVNERDRDPNELTADQQSSNKGDIEITRRIRQALLRDKDLSTYAHNIKIITIDGRVTVKGPVRTKDEEKTILKSAHDVAGISSVINEMAITR
ncbi:MAG: BON domain-containing protein [Pseudomonadota bacterium]|nr:BON domain-containing protein [Pseudomonadota bacterium]